jgi:hypothetical protein
MRTIRLNDVNADVSSSFARMLHVFLCAFLSVFLSVCLSVFLSVCLWMCGCGNTGDEAILRNGLAWTLLYHGLPITYYGTEQPAIAGLADQRTAMWPHYGTRSNLISHYLISSSSYNIHVKEEC